MLPATAQARIPRLINQLTSPDISPAEEIVAGLMQTPAVIAPKYFYDALGSRLFDAITSLPEYYPTRVEAAIFEQQGQSMAEALGQTHTLVDLGAGNCEKAGRLFAALKPQRYVAVDISVDHLQQALLALQRHFPAMEMMGVGTDFSGKLTLPQEAGSGPRVMFYPGSSIGNFTPAAALGFLKQVHREAQGGGLIIGVDRIKATPMLNAAYDDALKVTAAFNLNVLHHVNALAGCDFSITDWEHVAFFNESESRIEMHLQARHDLRVSLGRAYRDFTRGERIHTENSYKYQPAQFEAMLGQAGFREVRHFTDAQNLFSVFVARA